MASRKVIIQLALAADPANGRVAEAVAKQVESAQTKAQRASDRTAKAQARAVRDAEKLQRDWVANHARAMTQMHAAEERLARDRAVYNARAAEGFKQTTSGVVQLARSVTLLAVSSEKDLERALRMLAKFEAGANAAKGAVDLVQGGGKLIGGLRAGAALAGGAGAGTGGAVGALASVVGPAAAVAAGLALVGGGLTMWYEKLTGSANELDSWTTKFGDVGAAIMRNFGNDQGDAKTRRMQLNLDTDRRIQDDSLVREEQAYQRDAGLEREDNQFRGEQFSSNVDRARSRAGMGLTGNARAAAQNRAASESAQAALKSTMYRTARNPEHMGANLSNRLPALELAQTQLEKVIDLEEEKARIANESAQTGIDRAKKEVSLQRESLKTVQDRIKAAEQERKSALDVLSAEDLDFSEQDKILRGARTVRGGGELDIDTARSLDKVGLSEFSGAIESSKQTEVQRRGLGELLDPLNSQITADRNKAATINSKITLDEKVVIQLEENKDRVGDLILDRLGPWLEKRDQLIQARVQAMFDQRNMVNNAKDAQARLAGQ